MHLLFKIKKKEFVTISSLIFVDDDVDADLNFEPQDQQGNIETGFFFNTNLPSVTSLPSDYSNSGKSETVPC